MNTLVNITIVAFLVSYFIPAIVAARRKTKYRGEIFLINLLFGWTILGWVAAMLWAAAEREDVLPILTKNSV